MGRRGEAQQHAAAQHDSPRYSRHRTPRRGTGGRGTRARGELVKVSGDKNNESIYTSRAVCMVQAAPSGSGCRSRGALSPGHGPKAEKSKIIVMWAVPTPTTEAGQDGARTSRERDVGRRASAAAFWSVGRPPHATHARATLLDISDSQGRVPRHNQTTPRAAQRRTQNNRRLHTREMTHYARIIAT